MTLLSLTHYVPKLTFSEKLIKILQFWDICICTIVQTTMYIHNCIFFSEHCVKTCMHIAIWFCFINLLCAKNFTSDEIIDEDSQIFRCADNIHECIFAFNTVCGKMYMYKANYYDDSSSLTHYMLKASAKGWLMKIYLWIRHHS